MSDDHVAQRLSPPTTMQPVASPPPDAALGRLRRIVSALGGWKPTVALGAFLILWMPVGATVGHQPLIGLAIGFLVATPLERAFKRHDFPILREGFRTDVLHFTFTTLFRTICQGASILLSYLVLRGLAFGPTTRWLASLPLWGYFIVAYLAISLTYYAEHRLAHSWGFLWRFHAVHHSPKQLDWLAATKLHPIEGLIGGFVLAPPLVLFGFGLEFQKIAAVFAVFSILDVLVHANVSWRMRWLDGIIGTPEYHHWHHVSQPVRDKNFSLPIIDKIFGTYYMPKDGSRPEIYGIDEPMPQAYVAQLAFPFRRRSGQATTTA